MSATLVTLNGVETAQKTKRVIVEVASNELELDSNGVAVPKYFDEIDLVGNQDAFTEVFWMIARMIIEANDYGIVRVYEPDDFDVF